MASINKVTNANVYVDGIGFAGKASEVELPKVTSIMEEQGALGLIGQVELPSGLEKMEAMIKWNSMYPEILRKAYDPTTGVSLQIRSEIAVYENNTLVQRQPVKAFISGTFKDVSGMNFQQNQVLNVDTALNVNRFRLEIAGERIVEVDLLNNIHFVGNRDILAQYRINLGL